MTDLRGKVAIVTGSGNGIGRATVKKIAESGAKVTVSDVIVEDGERTVAEIKAAGGEAIFVKADVSQEAEVKNLIDTTVSTFGGLDILVNNAGVGGGQLRTHEIELITHCTVDSIICGIMLVFTMFMLSQQFYTQIWT
jgi:NAD(P)-dependent dehydrogenase (short-subunit alcohol dehydrogenase family)